MRTAEMVSIGGVILSGTETAQSGSVQPEMSDAGEQMKLGSIALEPGAEFNSLLHQMLVLIGPGAEQFHQSPEIPAGVTWDFPSMDDMPTTADAERKVAPGVALGMAQAIHGLGADSNPKESITSSGMPDRMNVGEFSENRQIPVLRQAAPEGVEPRGQGAVLEGPSHANGSTRWPLEVHLPPIPTGESMVSKEVPRPFINPISEVLQEPIPIASPRLEYLEKEIALTESDSPHTQRASASHFAQAEAKTQAPVLDSLNLIPRASGQKVIEASFDPRETGAGRGTHLLQGLLDRSGLALAETPSRTDSVHGGSQAGSSTSSVPQRLSNPVVDQPSFSESQRLDQPSREGAYTDTRVTALPKGQKDLVEPLTNASFPKSIEVLPPKSLLTQMRELSVPDIKVGGLMLSAAGFNGGGVKRDSGSDSSVRTSEAPSTDSSLTHLKSPAQNVSSPERSLRYLPFRNEEQFSHSSFPLQRLAPMELEKEVTRDAMNVFRYVPDLSRRLTEEIVRDLTLRNLSTSPEIRVALEPKFLGLINLKVKMEEGKVAAQIDVSNPLVKLVLETNLPQLHAALNAKGIEVSRLEVLASGEACGREPNGQNTWRQRDSHKRRPSGGNMEQYQIARLMGYNTMELVM